MSTNTYKKAKPVEVFRYSFGGLGSNLGFGITMMYILFFFTDVAGITPAAAGVIILIAKCVDAIIDPFIGVIVDRTKSRFGKLRPWIIFGAPLLAINLLLLFFVPNFDSFGRTIYAGLIYVLFSFTSSFVNIPYHSLTAVITEDPNQRTLVATAKQMMAIPAMLIVSAATLPLVNAFGGGKKGWFLVGLCLSIISMIAFWICASSAKRHDLPHDAESMKEEKVPLKEQLKLFFHNKPLLILIGAALTIMIATSTGSAVNMYYFIYNLGRQDLIPVLGLFGTLASLSVAIFIPRLSKIFGKKKLFTIGCTLSIIPNFLLFLTPFSNITMISILSVSGTMFAQIGGIVMWAMLPDCVEYAVWKMNIRGEATISAGLSFANQFGNAFGSMGAGLVLGAVGYVAGAQQSKTTLDAILFMKTLFPAIAYGLAVIIIKFYPITNKFYDTMLKDIRDRKQVVADDHLQKSSFVEAKFSQSTN